MRLRYMGTGDPTDSAICEAFGHVFPKGEWVTVSDGAHKLLGNPVFEVEKDKPAKAVKAEVTPAPEPAENPHPRTSETPEERALVDIPEGWSDMPWFAIKSLAAKLTDEPVTDKPFAIAAIEAEIERRNQA